MTKAGAWIGVVWVSGVLVGLNFHDAIAPPPKPGIEKPAVLSVAKPPEITADERAFGILYQETKPMDVVVHILSYEAFSQRRSSPLVVGFAHPYKSPCEIFIPEGWMLKADLKSQRVRWSHEDQDDTLAHELLHCLRGSWHE